MTSLQPLTTEEKQPLPDCHSIEISNLPTYSEEELTWLNKEANDLEEWLYSQENTISADEVPLFHKFAPGIYIREIHMKAPVILVGKQHTTEHFNIILKGRAVVKWDGKKEVVTGPCSFPSAAGIRKAMIILEDTVWQTIHANPDNETDIDILEARISIPSAIELAQADKLLKENKENAVKK